MSISLVSFHYTIAWQKITQRWPRIPSVVHHPIYDAPSGLAYAWLKMVKRQLHLLYPNLLPLFVNVSDSFVDFFTLYNPRRKSQASIYTAMESSFHADKRAEKMIIRYKECMKNHAATLGGNATDGCGEFMAAGEEGTLEALKCSACNCHRNFHRKEIECDSNSTPLIPDIDNTTQIIRPILAHLSPNKSGSISPSEQSYDKDYEDGINKELENPSEKVKKRFRTKFTQEQKEKMLGFAERAGWRMQKQEESVVQKFCQEVGIKRRVLKVWMHNNKNNFAKRSPYLPSN
ncbi:hypothetical protein RJT34_23371 [Clitoria ternatea]|uniref:ZF-HD dimerization-type domain-containing protein n=1 Tax=Clitoria ternatea TaxID=43366 RepID=A0AAN9FUJ8_CLITE